MPETEWKILYRPMATPVYEGWKILERQIAAKNGIAIPAIDTLERKLSPESCAAFTAVFECLVAHFQKYSDEDWANF
jgi:hypothetical protein